MENLTLVDKKPPNISFRPRAAQPALIDNKEAKKK